jgi:hypothetical protein
MGFQIAAEDVNADEKYVVCLGEKEYQMSGNVEVVMVKSMIHKVSRFGQYL